MSVYNQDDYSEEDFDRIIGQAEAEGKRWYIDLGDDLNGEIANFLIVEDGKMEDEEPNDHILAQQELEDFAGDSYMDNIEASDIL